MDQNTALREHLVKLLDWQEAHAGFEKTIEEGIPPELRGAQPQGAPYSPWQLLEHMRVTQYDILDFCINPDYKERTWPDEYWPESVAPPAEDAWEESISLFKENLTSIMRLALSPEIDLFAPIPHGNGQTYLREILLVADHNSYHLGQFVVLRRLLGVWE